MHARNPGAQRIHRVRVVRRPRPAAERDAERDRADRVLPQIALVDVELRDTDDAWDEQTREPDPSADGIADARRMAMKPDEIASIQAFGMISPCTDPPS